MVVAQRDLLVLRELEVRIDGRDVRARRDGGGRRSTSCHAGGWRRRNVGGIECRRSVGSIGTRAVKRRVSAQARVAEGVREVHKGWRPGEITESAAQLILLV